MSKINSKLKAKPISSLAKTLTSSEKRASIRFEPDPGTLAWVDVVNAGKRKNFDPSLVAIVTEESHRGCGLVMKMARSLDVGSSCKVKVGHSAPLRAEVRWRVELDAQTMRLGLMYLE